MEMIVYDSIWDIGQNCTARRYNILRTEGDSINGPFSWGVVPHPLIPVKILATPEYQTLTAEDIIYHNDVPTDKRTGYIYTHQFDQVDAKDDFEKACSLVTERLRRRFDRVLQELNNPNAKPLFTWIGFGEKGQREVGQVLQDIIPPSSFSVDLAKEVLQYLHDHFPADSRLLYLDYKPGIDDGHAVEYSDDHLVAAWHTIANCDNIHTIDLAGYFTKLMPELLENVRPVAGYSIKRFIFSECTKFVHLSLIFEDGKPVRYVINLQAKTGHCYKVDGDQFDIKEWVPNTQLRIIWKDSGVQYNFTSISEETFRLTDRTQFISCKHRRWGEKAVQMQVKWLHPDILRYTVGNTEGKIYTFKEKRYVIIYRPDNTLEQFNYNKGVYEYTPFIAKPTTAPKVVHLQLIRENNIVQDCICEVAKHRGKRSEANDWEFTIQDFVPQIRLSIVWEKSNIQEDFKATENNTYKLIYLLQKIRCQHPEWDDDVEQLSLELVNETSGASKCLGKNKRGYVGCFKEKSHIIIAWEPTHLMEQFIYHDGIYVYTPFPEKHTSPQVLIGIATSGKTWVTQQGQLDTWLKNLPLGCSYTYYFSAQDSRAKLLALGREDVLKLSASNTTLELTFAFFEWALQQPGWRWLIKTTDNCWLNTAAITHMMSPDVDVLLPDDVISSWNTAYAGATCECLRRSVVEYILEHKDEIKTLTETNYVGIHGMLLHQNFLKHFLIQPLPACLSTEVTQRGTFAQYYIVQTPKNLVADQAAEWLRMVHNTAAKITTANSLLQLKPKNGLVFSIFIGDKLFPAMQPCVQSVQRVCEKQDWDYKLFYEDDLDPYLTDNLRQWIREFRAICDSTKARTYCVDILRFYMLSQFSQQDVWYLDCDIQAISDTLPVMPAEKELYFSTFDPGTDWIGIGEIYKPRKLHPIIVPKIADVLFQNIKKLFGDPVDPELVNYKLPAINPIEVIGANVAYQWLKKNDPNYQYWEAVPNPTSATCSWPKHFKDLTTKTWFYNGI